MSGYVKEGDSKLMSFRIDNEKLMEKYKATWIKVEDLKNIELNPLPVYYEIYLNQNKNIQRQNLYKPSWLKCARR